MNATGVGGFKPGQSGNPSGRKTRDPNAEDFASILARNVKPEDWDAVVQAAVRDAKGRGVAAQKAREWLTDRAFGKVKEQVEVSGDILLVCRREKLPN